MNYIADLHIHSRFSMATSRHLTIPHLAWWAVRKGIRVLGTGDFTHPKWRAELKDTLVFDEESGFYRLNDPVAKNTECDKSALFCLQTEISCIYKRGGKVRKVHNLLYAPTLETADKIALRLEQVGNINSDGRPILGLDSRDLLEIALECSPQCVLVPAHIWTPWFSLFGSKSGFDDLRDCYGDLSDHIFALETGLSSDPPMNRYLSALDKYALISNSDAHSGANLGREANVFAGRPSWGGMFDSLRASAGRPGYSSPDCQFLGTMEFYPEEGKYHLDGHRACNVALDPAESMNLGNICPVCGKPLTIGVLHRVMELADRSEPASLPGEPEARMLVPLAEVMGQILGARSNSRKVLDAYEKAISILGPELSILCDLPVSDISNYWEPLGEAVDRIRKGKVGLNPGFDGRFGIISIFDPSELAELGGNRLPGLPPRTHPRAGYIRTSAPFHKTEKTDSGRIELSQDQQAVVTAGEEPVLAIAGPGSGKTRCLVERVRLLVAQGFDAKTILAITFTRKAAGEMADRLARILPSKSMPICDTLHGLAWDLMRKACPEPDKLILLGDEAAFGLFKAANPEIGTGDLKKIWRELSFRREKGIPPNEFEAWHKYENLKTANPVFDYVDYGDLLDWLVNHSLEMRGRWSNVLVDEIQDLSPLQLEIIRRIAPAEGNGVFCIGDPDQSIYEFRGAGGAGEGELRQLWPDLRVFHLNESYRSSQKILDLAGDLLNGKPICGRLRAARDIPPTLKICNAPDEHFEARWIASRIRKMLGSSSHTIADTRHDDCLTPGDIAILTRLKAQMPPILAALEKAGIACDAPASDEFWHDSQCSGFLERVLEAQASAPPEELLKTAHFADLPGSNLLPQNPCFKLLAKMWAESGSWENFFNILAWKRETEIIRSKSERVSLLTLHAAKGLEFKAVFIPGMEKGLLPLDRDLLYKGMSSGLGVETVAAEGRLIYVGATRAASSLFFSHCRKRTLHGKILDMEPSPWLKIISPYCMDATPKIRVATIEESLYLFGDNKA